MGTLDRSAIAVALALAAVLVFTSAITGQSAPDETGPRPALADHEVFGFLPYWELPRAASIDLGMLTTLAWFGVEAGRDGRLVREIDGEEPPGWAGWTSEEFVTLRERAQAQGVRTVLVVERFSWTTVGTRATKRLLREPDARATLVREITEAVTSAGADGVNLDFEPLPRSVRGEFVRLVRALRRSLDAVDPSLQLTFDLTPDVESFPLRRLLAEGAADAAVLMGYEYRTPGSRVAGSVAPLRDPAGLDVRESVARALRQVPADKIILALPWYGRAWSTRTDEPGARTRRAERYLGPSTALYRISVPRAAASGRRWDRRQASAWTVYQGRSCETCPVSPRQLWYDDVDSVKAKVGLARRRDLRGVGIWALGYEGERPELWAALRFSLDRPRDAEPPSGAASVEASTAAGSVEAVPLVTDRVTLALTAADDPGGSGVAFVRIGTRARLDDDGALRFGTTYPAVETLTLSMPDGGPLDDVFTPGAAADPPASAAPQPSPDVTTTERVVLRLQWRDIAGNWSEPLRLPLDHVTAAASDQEP